jgi:hypothetical protein
MSIATRVKLQNLIDGEFVDAADGAVEEVTNPANGEVIAEVPNLCRHLEGFDPGSGPTVPPCGRQTTLSQDCSRFPTTRPNDLRSRPAARRHHPGDGEALHAGGRQRSKGVELGAEAGEQVVTG